MFLLVLIIVHCTISEVTPINSTNLTAHVITSKSVVISKGLASELVPAANATKRDTSQQNETAENNGATRNNETYRPTKIKGAYYYKNTTYKGRPVSLVVTPPPRNVNRNQPTTHKPDKTTTRKGKDKGKSKGKGKGKGRPSNGNSKKNRVNPFTGDHYPDNSRTSEDIENERAYKEPPPPPRPPPRDEDKENYYYYYYYQSTTTSPE